MAESSIFSIRIDCQKRVSSFHQGLLNCRDARDVATTVGATARAGFTPFTPRSNRKGHDDDARRIRLSPRAGVFTRPPPRAGRERARRLQPHTPIDLAEKWQQRRLECVRQRALSGGAAALVEPPQLLAARGAVDLIVETQQPQPAITRRWP